MYLEVDVSYNPYPKWASIDLSSIESNKYCPRCRSDETNYDEVISFEPGYDSPAHIPSSIDLQCYSCSLQWKVSLEIKLLAMSLLIDEIS